MNTMGGALALAGCVLVLAGGTLIPKTPLGGPASTQRALIPVVSSGAVQDDFSGSMGGVSPARKQKIEKGQEKHSHLSVPEKLICCNFWEWVSLNLTRTVTIKEIQTDPLHLSMAMRSGLAGQCEIFDPYGHDT